MDFEFEERPANSSNDGIGKVADLYLFQDPRIAQAGADNPALLAAAERMSPSTRDIIKSIVLHGFLATLKR